MQLYTGSVVFIVLAKLMEVAEFGILSFGFSLSAMAVIVADFGFSLMVIKDYPQQVGAIQKYLGNSILAKMFIALVSSSLFLTYLFVFYQAEWLKVGALYVLFAIIASFVLYLQAVLKVQNRFDKFTKSNIVYALAVTISVLLFWKFDVSLLQLVACLLFSKFLQLLYVLYFCRRSLAFSVKDGQIGYLLKSSWSFGVFSILGIFYFMVDTQIISVYLGAKDVALYQSVFRIVLILMVFSDIVSSVLLPYLSFKFFKNKDVTELVSKLFLYLLIIGCSLFLAFTSFKEELLTFLYTEEYRQAAVLVLPFSMVVIIRTISTLLGNILTISNKQVYRVITVGISLLLSLVLNLMCIPKYGILAGAWISVLVHFVLFGLYLVYSKKEVPAMQLHTLTNLFLVLVTAGIYLVIHVYTRGTIPTVLACAVFWILAIFGIMKKGNNLKFLKQILGEKGAG